MLNENQKLAVEHFMGPCLTIAPPGSGKTKCLVERVAFLIKEHHVLPDKILVLTFTKEAACEMKERFCREYSSYEKMPFFGTFHSLFYYILKEETGLSGGQIISQNKSVFLLKEALKKCHIQEKGINCMELIKEFSRCINQSVSFQSIKNVIPADGLESLYQEYNRQKEINHCFDFDDLMVRTKELFQKHPTLNDKWKNRFSFILLDEMQDINQLQFDIVKMLLDENENIFAVGDDDQSIYEFRGSRPDIMLSFQKQFQNARLIYLDTNYRSLRQIVSISSHFISHNKERFDKEIHSFLKGYGRVSYYNFSNETEQGLYVANKIKEISKDKKIGILFRNKSDGMFLSKMLEMHGITYFSKDEFVNHIQKKIIGELIAYLKAGNGCVDDGVKRALYGKPNGDFTVIPHLSFYAAINYIRKGIGYDRYLYETYGYDNALYDNALLMCEYVQESIKSLPKDFRMEDIEDYFKDADMKSSYRVVNKEDSNVFLHTFHGAKGLEFDEVFCININEGIVPSPLNEGGLEEERRMFYVAITRARFHLSICCIKNRGGKSYRPSRFIDELKN